MPNSKSAYSFSNKKEKFDTHIIVVWVDNEAGVLARVVGLFSGRGYKREDKAVIFKEMALFKIVGPNNKLKGALKACKKYNPVLLDKTKKSNVIQITALRREIDKMSKDLKKFGLVSVSRTGAVAMTRGADIFK